MKELFFSLVSRQLFMVPLENDKIVKKIYEDNYRKHSENFVSKVRETFSSAAFLLNDLDKIFFLTGPGGQTGERVSFSFVIGSLLASSKIKAFSMDSLTFQAATSEKCLSIISIGDKSKSYHLIVYQNRKVSFRKEKIREEELEEVKRAFPELLVIIDFEGVDFLYNFLLCKKEFKPFKND